MEPIPTPPPEVDDDALWTPDDIAAFLRCTVRHVQNLQKSGLPYFHIGRLVRFDPDEVREFLKNNRRVSLSVERRARRKNAASITRR